MSTRHAPLQPAALEMRFQIAEAKLRVAEDLRWVIAQLAGLLVFFQWDSWLLAVGVVGAVIFIVPYWYSKAYDTAWDEFEKATGTGKYLHSKEEMIPPHSRDHDGMTDGSASSPAPTTVTKVDRAEWGQSRL